MLANFTKALLAFGSTEQGKINCGGGNVVAGRVEKGARPRPDILKVVVSAAERAAIEERAVSTGLSLSAFLRKLGTGYEPKSTLDRRAVQDLVKVNADQGRLGGLLKLWLTDRAAEGAPTTDVRRLLKEIEETQVLLRSLVQRL